ncbi:MAG: molybdenum cofactor biosysynthesis protein [Verrucomicrobiales bacterium]|nr:molybdenum cofactor biosysynthesis protein [Verrucomicrobiales bacterium]
MKILNLYISPGHNYYGHFGKPPGENPIIEVGELDCVAGKGIQGDRFFDYKEDYKGQITFFEIETHRKLCEEFAVFDKGPETYRRNVVVEEQDLNELIGQEFEIQGIRFLGTEEAKPCFWMDQAFGEGAERALKGKGGLRARILDDGLLKCGE